MIPEKMRPHNFQIMSIFKMQPLSQEAMVTLSLQEQVLFCIGADEPCKDTEVAVFTLVQSQIAFFFFFFFVSVDSQMQSVRWALCRSRMFL